MKQHRQWLIESVRTHLLPAFVEHGFDVAPHVSRGLADRDFLLALPLGRLIRHRMPDLVDLAEIEFAPHGAPAFQVIAGTAPKEGLMTFSGHWAAEDLYAGWLDECFVTHARPWLRFVGSALGAEDLGAWFSVWYAPWQTPASTDYERLALRVAGYQPEIEVALRGGRLGPHLRKVVISHPKPPGPQFKE